MADTLNVRGTERVEAFSDSVFAIAMTLLVLNLYDPTTRGSALTGGLIDEWPAFFALVTSFLTILVMWMNHHNMFNYIERVSRELMLLNGLLLLFVVIVPFTTRLVSEHLLSSDASVAAIVYTASVFLLSIVWNILWHDATHHHNLIYMKVPQIQIKRVTREYLVGLFLYGFAVVLAFVSPIASVALIILIAVYYAITVTGGELVQH